MHTNIFIDRGWDNKNTDIDAMKLELHQLHDKSDKASLIRRFELHLNLAYRTWKRLKTLGQEQAEQALAIARQLGDRLREADALHAFAEIYLYEHYNPRKHANTPTSAEGRKALDIHIQALQIREQVLGPEDLEVGRSANYITKGPMFWPPYETYFQYAERATSIFERSLGPDHDLTITARESLALTRRIGGG